MLTTLLLLVLSTLGTWDLLMRLLPVRLPVIAAKLMCLAIPWSLLNYAPRSIILILCVPGVLVLLGRLIAYTNVPATEPWGRYLSLRRKPAPAPSPRRMVGRRIPPL